MVSSPCTEYANLIGKDMKIWKTTYSCTFIRHLCNEPIAFEST